MDVLALLDSLAPAPSPQGAGAATAPRPPGGRWQAVVRASAESAAAHPPLVSAEDAELLAMVVVDPRAPRATAPRGRAALRHGHHSADWMEHMRSRKEEKRQMKKAEENDRKRLKAEADVRTLVTQMPSLACLIGRRPKPRTPEERADFVKWLAVQGRRATNESFDRQQHRAQDLLANAVLTAQKAWLKESVWPAAEAGSQLLRRKRVLVIQHQFDEALQRVKSAVGRSAWKKVRENHSQKLVKYFLQSGHVHVFDGEMYFDAPWLCKPIAMMTQNWYTIVDSLLKVCPFNVDRPSDCKSMLAVLTVLVLQFGADRFAANKRALSWLFGTIATTLPPHVWPHFEPCWSHGFALVKSLCYAIKDVVKVAAGFSRLVKTDKGAEQFRDSLMEVFRMKFVRLVQPPPRDDQQRTGRRPSPPPPVPPCPPSCIIHPPSSILHPPISYPPPPPSREEGGPSRALCGHRPPQATSSRCSSATRTWTRTCGRAGRVDGARSARLRTVWTWRCSRPCYACPIPRMHPTTTASSTTAGTARGGRVVRMTMKRPRSAAPLS